MNLSSAIIVADAYQEGCVSALIDGDTPLWLSSGLEGKPGPVCAF